MYNKLKITILTAIFAALTATFADALTDAQISSNISAKLRQPIKTHFGAFNFDIFDFPQEQGCTLELLNVNDRTVSNINVDNTNQIVVLVAVNPEDSRHGENWELPEATNANHAVDNLTRFYNEFSASNVAVYGVWLPKKNDDVEQNISNAVDYAAETSFPCPLMIETNKFVKPSGSSFKSAFTQYIGLKIPGHTYPDISCLKDKNNKIVFRGYEHYSGFSYHTYKHLVNRILSPSYETATRIEFAGSKSRVLPVTNVTAEGIFLKDDFEGYADNHDFKLQPRWGFSYERQSRLDVKAALLEGEGRSGSTAAEITHEYNCLNMTPYPLQHRFPEPLSNGYVRFYIKRHPQATEGEAGNGRAFCITFDKPGTDFVAGHLFATGEWESETFVTNFIMTQPSHINFSVSDWHEIVVECSPGQKAKIKVDNQPFGQLNSEVINWVGFRMNQSNPTRSFLIDDFEIFYSNKTSVAANYADSYPPAADFTTEEQEWIYKSIVPELKGDPLVELPQSAIPRKDFYDKWEIKKSFNFNCPLVLDDLILEDMKNPGNLVNVSKKYKGKIIYIAKVVKGDHANEGALRRRSGTLSPTIFNRVYTLAKELKDNTNVVVIGVVDYDAGHRDTCTSAEDKRREYMEVIDVSKDLAVELNQPKTKIIYGAFDDVYDEILWEPHANQMRLWSKSFRGELNKGSFGGRGVDVILDKKGRCVFRSKGIDGFDYWEAKYVIERLLDPDFDVAVRQEFRNKHLENYRPPLLPVQIEQAGGLLYKDDFENYFNAGDTEFYHATFNFALEPCWGFRTTFTPSSRNPASIQKKCGISNSTALLINDYSGADTFGGNTPDICGRHFFPAPLSNGYFSIMLKRGAKTPWRSFGRPPLYRFGLIIYGENGKYAQKYSNYDSNRDFDEYHSEVLSTLGDWESETFATFDSEKFVLASAYKNKDLSQYLIQDTGIPMSLSNWHEIKIVCSSGEFAKIMIDGADAYTLTTKFVTGIEFRGESWSGTYVDDAELFYEGDPAELKQTHQKAIDDEFEEYQQRWESELEEPFTNRPVMWTSLPLSTLDFGFVQVGFSVTSTFFVGNGSSNIVLAGSVQNLSSPFSVVEGAPYSVTNYSSSAITMVFTPDIAKTNYTDEFLLQGNQTQVIIVKGNSVPEPMGIVMSLTVICSAIGQWKSKIQNTKLKNIKRTKSK